MSRSPRKKTEKKPWGGRFTEETDREVERFTASIPFDRRLFRYDIEGSIAHVKALGEIGVLSKKEIDAIVRGLVEIRLEMEREEAKAPIEDEDIHMHVEKRLVAKIGETGKKLHTGRSRNDQVATDLRLYLREETARIRERAALFQRALVDLARKEGDTILPGYTHLQRAQPVLLAHHLLAYVEMLERDKERLAEVRARVNILPLGSGALAGSNFPLPRDRVAKMLGFSGVSRNSIDAVSDRDFAIEFLSAAAVLMMHLSRFSEELILWSSAEFGFVDLPDRFCTGSSMMPQKKNPDVLELVRGKTGRIYGGLLSMLTILKGLPLSYNRDLQEDKEPLFDAVDTLKGALSILARLSAGIRVNRKRMMEAASEGGLLATDLADDLVDRGVSFREAHAIVGQVVRYALDRKKPLDRLTVEELKRFSSRFNPEMVKGLSVERSVARKKTAGGTAPGSVRSEIAAWERKLKKELNLGENRI
ncbi:MAG TPA: argininosuccinate lyase [Nitrospiria bacterium]|nr:argininosuccinate lyase [Nitrospiria bacterium]